MSSLLIGNIGQLITNSDKELGILDKAALVVENQKVVWVGSSEAAPDADNYLDAENGVVTPGFVDSHTHAIFAGDRSRDYVARMSGNKYATGGIKTTVAATRSATDAELKLNLERILQYSKSNGTTTIEIKSGYGLDIETEVKILKIAKEYTSETTFLGAHVIPNEYSKDRREYVNLVKGEMLDAVLPYAKWIDVFCDTGAFTVDEAREILKSGMVKGLKGRIHGNQLGDTGGVELALELGLASVDHASHISDASIEALANSEVVTTFLPGAEFFTKSAYPNAKKLLDLGATVALATDCNPGSSFISSMPVVMAMAIRDMGFTPAQAMAAATLGGAKALKRTDIGHLSAGASADLIIWQAPTYEHIPYRMGEINKKVLANGQIQ